jgi:hypothetical protein
VVNTKVTFNKDVIKITPFTPTKMKFGLTVLNITIKKLRLNMTSKTKLCISFLRGRQCNNPHKCTYAHNPSELVECTDSCTKDRLCGKIHRKIETESEYIARSNAQQESRTLNRTPPIRTPSPQFPPMTFDYMPKPMVQDSYMFEINRVTNSCTTDLQDYIERITKLGILANTKMLLISQLRTINPSTFKTDDSACLWLNTLVSDVLTNPQQVQMIDKVGLPPAFVNQLLQYITFCVSG